MNTNTNTNTDTNTEPAAPRALMTLRDLARKAGRAETTLVRILREHQIPTMRLGSATVVGADALPRVKEIVRENESRRNNNLKYKQQERKARQAVQPLGEQAIQAQVERVTLAVTREELASINAKLAQLVSEVSAVVNIQAATARKLDALQALLKSENQHDAE